MSNKVYILMGQDGEIYGIFNDRKIAHFYGEKLSLDSPYHYKFDLLECEKGLNRPDLGWMNVVRTVYYQEGCVYSFSEDE